VIRVAIVPELQEIVVARGQGRTLVAMPTLMPYADCYEQATALYTDEEAATFRAYYNVPAANRGAGWADVLPGIVCPCHTPERLRLPPWPPCPLHDRQGGERVGIVEVAERMLSP
jgi:hypothetical protein